MATTLRPEHETELNGAPAFVRAGWALKRIRDGRLYRGHAPDELAYYEAIVTEAIGQKKSSVQLKEHPNTKPPRRRTHVVYFIEGEGTGLVKIGFAESVSSRISQMRTGSPVRLILLCTITGGKDVEREMHRRFSADRSHGEWFRLSDAIKAFICEQKGL